MADLNSLILNSAKSDSYTYEYFLQGDVCRLCWQKNDLASNTINLNGVKIELMDVIRDCLDVDLCEDNYPNKVCERCLELVNKFYSFKIHCKEADRKLRQIINAGYTTVPTEIPVKSEVVKNQCKADIGAIEDTFGKEQITLTDLKKTYKSKVLKTREKPRKSENYCYICCIDLKDSKNFNEHNSSSHGIQNGMYKCFGCDKLFKNTRTRTSHETNFCKALKQGYKCPVCDRYLPLRKLYEAHMRYHAGKENDVVPELTENIFKCRKCDASFKTKDMLKEHMATHSSIDNHYVCETCGNVFRRQDYLQKHIMIHMGLKRYACSHCGLRFIQKSSLNVHLRNHTGERPYVCDVCPQRCVSSSNLRAHRRRHLGIKKFECAVCGKKFGYKVSLAEHVEAAHAPAQRHPCALCGAEYARRKGLQRHSARKHGVGVAPSTVAEQ